MAFSAAAFEALNVPFNMKDVSEPTHDPTANGGTVLCFSHGLELGFESVLIADLVLATPLY